MILWTFEHVITVIPTIVASIIIVYILNKFLGKKSYETRMIPLKVVSVLFLVIELGKQIASCEGGYDLYSIPLHFCSLVLYSLPVMAFYRGKHSDKIFNVGATYLTAIFLFMVIYPNLLYSSNAVKGFFTDYLDFHTVFFHNLVLFTVILIFGLNLHEPTENVNLAILLGDVIFLIPSALMAQLLKTNYNNFYKCNIAPLENVRLLVQDSIGYAGAQVFYVAILFILNIGFVFLAYYTYRFAHYGKKCIFAKLNLVYLRRNAD